MKIAFIGLGNMGGGMAANLVKAGHEVRAFDLSQDALACAWYSGCQTFNDAAEAVQGVEAVVTMLPSGAIVQSVYEASIIGKAPAGAVFLDCSTIDVETARQVIARAEGAGYSMVDAPVSGGTVAAKDGTLTFMVGGSAEAFAQARPVLEPMGKALIHAGPAGNGQAAKICNNMLLGIHMVGTCEALVLAQTLGLDPQAFYDISSVSSGQCWSMTSYCPLPGVGPTTPADAEYRGGFATSLMLKDLKLAVEAAQSVGVDTQLGRRAKELYEVFEFDGNSDVDFSGIIQSISKKELIVTARDLSGYEA